MKLRTKLPIFTSITVLLAITVIAAFSIFSFKNEIEKSIKHYRYEETNKILDHLQDIVDISYSMIDNSFRASTASAIEERYNIHFADSSDIIIKMIAINIRFSCKCDISYLTTISKCQRMKVARIKLCATALLFTTIKYLLHTYTHTTCGHIFRLIRHHIQQ